jgi:putative hydrolase of the HAD superfamily
MVPLPPAEQIEAVMFDAGGVLLVPQPSAHDALEVMDCRPSPEDWVRSHYLSMRAGDTMEPLDWPSVRRVFASALGIPDHHIDTALPIIDELLIDASVPGDGASEVIRSLGEAGYRLGVVSNAGGTIAAELEGRGICSITGDQCPQVGVVIDSTVVGVEKPDPSIFHLALNALGVAAATAVYVGDTVRFDVRGAEAAGLFPLHLDPYSLCDGAHAHIASLWEVAHWLLGS